MASMNLSEWDETGQLLKWFIFSEMAQEAPLR